MLSERDITPEMIEACAAEMVAHDWLSTQWNLDVPVCGCCQQPVPEDNRAATRPSPDDVRGEIRTFLSAALKAATGDHPDCRCPEGIGHNAMEVDDAAA